MPSIISDLIRGSRGETKYVWSSAAYSESVLRKSETSAPGHPPGKPAHPRLNKAVEKWAAQKHLNLRYISGTQPADFELAYDKSDHDEWIRSLKRREVLLRWGYIECTTCYKEHYRRVKTIRKYVHNAKRDNADFIGFVFPKTTAPKLMKCLDQVLVENRVPEKHFCGRVFVLVAKGDKIIEGPIECQPEDSDVQRRSRLDYYTPRLRVTHEYTSTRKTIGFRVTYYGNELGEYLRKNGFEVDSTGQQAVFEVPSQRYDEYESKLHLARQLELNPSGMRQAS